MGFLKRLGVDRPLTMSPTPETSFQTLQPAPMMRRRRMANGELVPGS